ncbi:MAG: Trm112 family protein [Nanoarchaeota archaeon]
MIRKELLEILACPKCKNDVEYNKKKNILRCDKCNKDYIIKNNIPIMI